MAIRTYIFLISLFGGGVTALRYPAVGVITYMGVYFLSPNQEYWGRSIYHLGIRYYFITAVFVGIGMLLNWKTLRERSSSLTGIEKCMLLFLGIAWVSGYLGIGVTAESSRLLDKMTKVVIFCLMMTHCVTSGKSYRAVRWAWVIGGLYLGYRCFSADASSFIGGRLTGIGGVDFKGSSGMGAHLAMTLPLVGVSFLLARSWWAKSICILGGGLIVNSLILMRTRGSFLGLAVALIVALVYAPKVYRRKIVAATIVALIAAFSLTDNLFWSRMDTINSGEDRGRSSTVRLEIWEGALSLIHDFPQGVGIGNFQYAIGDVAPKHRGRASHSTLIRILCDLGIQGFLVYLVMLWLCVRTLNRISRLGDRQEDIQFIKLESFGLGLAMVVAVTAGLFTERSYVEGYWWLFAMVVCLERSMRHELSKQRRTSLSDESVIRHRKSYQMH